MSACVNKVAFLGNLGKDPEVREIPSARRLVFRWRPLTAGRIRKGNARSEPSGTGWLPTMA